MITDLRSRRRPAGQGTAVFALGGNANTFAFVNSFRPEGGTITARMVPLAWTPVGVVFGQRWQNAGIALAGLLEWVDKTFPPEDDRSFVAPMRDIELLARIEWNAQLPERIDENAIINVEDVPEEILDGLAQQPADIVQCAACRRFCVHGDFVWKEKDLCAWDYHAQVFGKRGPWRNGSYEERYFETLPRCAYVVPDLLEEIAVEAVLATADVEDTIAHNLVNLLLDANQSMAHLAVQTRDGFTVLRERASVRTTETP